jgi:hypothetical protein
MRRAAAADALATAPPEPPRCIDRRAEAITALAPHLPPELLTDALSAAAAIDDPGQRALALAGLAPDARAAAVADARACAHAADEPYRRAHALIGLIPRLPPEQRAGAGTRWSGSRRTCHRS